MSRTLRRQTRIKRWRQGRRLGAERCSNPNDWEVKNGNTENDPLVGGKDADLCEIKLS